MKKRIVIKKAMKKQAGAFAPIKLESWALPLAVTALGATTVGLPLLVEAIHHAKLKRQQEQAYQVATKLYEPELRSYPEQEKRLYFHTLRTLAPSLATDPILVGTFLKQTLAMRSIDPNLIKNLREATPVERMVYTHTPPMATEAGKMLAQTILGLGTIGPTGTSGT
jgi:hypothetical protein